MSDSIDKLEPVTICGQHHTSLWAGLVIIVIFSSGAFIYCLLYVLALDESIDQAVAIPPAGDEVGLTTVQCVMVTVVLVVVVVARSDQLISDWPLTVMTWPGNPS